MACSTAVASNRCSTRRAPPGIAIVWTGVLTTIIALAIKYTIGWRIDGDAEVAGIDAAEHGESAYDLVGGTGSHHF